MTAKSKVIVFLMEQDWMNVFEGSGNFVFIKLKNSQIKERFINYLKKNKIFIRDYGHIKSTRTFVRITIGNESQMNVVINQIKKFSNNEG